jgi:dephospho-CoA kinase
MLRVALTGGIGSGKSSAAEIFAALGAVVVDSDEIARKVLDRESVGFGEVVAVFGDQILAAGEIDRKKLGQLVFSDPKERKKLEQITHPLIRKEFESIIKNLPENSIVINQIPLLAESKYDYKFDYVIAISAPIEVRKNRLIQRGMKSYEIEQRLAAQASDADRVKIANEVIENAGDLSQLTTNVEKVWRKLLALQSKNK